MEKQQIESIIAAQKEFFESGRTLDTSLRASALRRLYAAIDSHEEDLLRALTKDLGRCRTESYMCEIGLVKAEISYMLRHLARFAGEKRVRTPLWQFAARSFVKPVPYGNVLIMSPWNYPVLLALEPLVDALAAGNTAVIKPGAYAAASSEALRMLIGEAFPEKYVAVVTGGRDENSALLDCRFDMIFFTGGKTVGRTVLEKAAAHLTPVILELGGKSPCIVDETADIEVAARRIVFGKFINAGQTCVAPDYIYCAEAVRDKLADCLKEEISRRFGADPLKNDTYGKIINRAHFDRLNKLLEDAAARPGAEIYGGGSDPETLKIAPALITGADRTMAVMNEEIFGPILPILTYGDFEAAARDIECRESPLALYIFSSDRAHIDFVTSRVRFGGGCINDTLMHIASSEMGFGGVGESGMGAYHGREGFDAFSHKKSLVDKKIFPDLPMRYRPYKPSADKLIRLFLK